MSSQPQHDISLIRLDGMWVEYTSSITNGGVIGVSILHFGESGMKGTVQRPKHQKVRKEHDFSCILKY
jgi:hypothetical protein